MIKHLIIIITLSCTLTAFSQDSTNFEQRFELLKSITPIDDSIPKFLLVHREAIGLSDLVFKVHTITFSDFKKMTDSTNKKIDLNLTQIEGEVQYLNYLIGANINFDPENIPAAYEQLRQEFAATIEKMNQIEELKSFVDVMRNDPESEILMAIIDKNYVDYRKSHQMTDSEFISLIVNAKLANNISANVISAFEILELNVDQEAGDTNSTED